MRVLALLVWLSLLVSGVSAQTWESVRAQAEQANSPGLRAVGVFNGTGEQLHLAPSGYYTHQVFAGCGLGGPLPIAVGRYEQIGDRLILGAPSVVARPQYDAIAENYIYLAQPISLVSDPQEETEPREFWLLPQSSGLYLLEQEQLIDMANAINRSGELADWLLFARDIVEPERDDEDENESAKLSVEDRARLPAALQSLLRDSPVSANVARLLNASNLEWKYQRAELDIELDRGSQDGLFVGMQLRTSDVNRFSGEVKEVGPKRSVLRVGVERFHPEDSPLLPELGQTFVTPVDDQGCGGSPGFAVSGTIIALEPAEVGGLIFDEEGYAFATATLDVGAAAGLIVDDRLTMGRFGYRFDSRVREVHSSRSTVLIRVHRLGAQQLEELDFPRLGERLGTQAWASTQKPWNLLESD